MPCRPRCLCAVGTAAFVHAAYARIRREVHAGGGAGSLVHCALVVGAVTQSQGARFWRVGVLVGLVVLWLQYKDAAVRATRSALVRWGETLLDPDRVRHADGDLYGISNEEDDSVLALMGDVARALASDAREWCAETRADLRRGLTRAYHWAQDRLERARGYGSVQVDTARGYRTR